MLRSAFPLVLGLLIFVPLAVRGEDLTKIERTIRKEPTYRTKPAYCLLVFGPDAKTKVWLVQDGSTLYVDRHGNGDLTEPANKVEAEKNGAGEGSYAFNVGNIHDGVRLHKNLLVSVSNLSGGAARDEAIKSLLARNPGAKGYYISIDTDMPSWKGGGAGGRVQQQLFCMDARGVLQFADKPQDAPVIHFGGPWEITLYRPQSLIVGRQIDLVLGVGTPGVGPGTTAWIAYEGVIPNDVFPTLAITYPSRQPGGRPVVARYELKRRC
jgi:hypothetical protein